METRTLENSAAYLLKSVARMKNNCPRLRILDVGVGPGTISKGFAQTIPDGHVTAVDLSPHSLEKARNLARRTNLTNITFLQADIHKLPFADGSFDVTHCHQVLTHVQKPVGALQEMLRVTRPGGIVAAREGDLDTECMWPSTLGLVKFHAFVHAMMKARGGCTTSGRQLLSWAIEAGVERGQVMHSFSASCYSTPEEKGAWGEWLCILYFQIPLFNLRVL